MYNYNEIDNLKSDKRKLEYELTEERFHFESIPKRKAYSTANAVLSSIVGIPCLLILVGFVLAFVLFRNSPAILAICVSIIPYVAIPLLFVSIKIWKEFFSSISLLLGTRKKELSYGSANYDDEARKSLDKIQALKERIAKIDQALLESQSQCIFKDSIASTYNGASPESIYSEEFFSHAFGSWGEDKDILISNMHTDKYESEALELQKKIEEQNLLITTLAKRLATINSDYKYIKKKALVYIISILLIVFTQVFLISSVSGKRFLVIIGAIYVIALSIYMYFTCVNEYFAYQVEYNPLKYRDYAETHNMESIASMHHKCTSRIEDYNHRLEHVEKLLDYKHNILHLN